MRKTYSNARAYGPHNDGGRLYWLAGVDLTQLGDTRTWLLASEGETDTDEHRAWLVLVPAEADRFADRASAESAIGEWLAENDTVRIDRLTVAQVADLRAALDAWQHPEGEATPPWTIGATVAEWPVKYTGTVRRLVHAEKELRRTLPDSPGRVALSSLLRKIDAADQAAQRKLHVAV